MSLLAAGDGAEGTRLYSEAVAGLRALNGAAGTSSQQELVINSHAHVLAQQAREPEHGANKRRRA